MQQRVDERAFLDDLVVEAVARRGYGGREPGRAGADDEYVTQEHPVMILNCGRAGAGNGRSEEIAEAASPSG